MRFVVKIVETEKVIFKAVVVDEVNKHIEIVWLERDIAAVELVAEVESKILCLDMVMSLV